jgi:hypothetical protein
MVVDSASNVYVSANLRSTAQDQDSEIWFARDAHPGATSVTVTVSGGSAATAQVWVLEASGLAATGGIDDGQATSNGDASTTIVAPTVTPSGVPALIVAAVGSNGNVGGIAQGNPFVALPIEDDNGAAYYIATDGGTFGPVFGNTDQAWNASVAAFR